MEKVLEFHKKGYNCAESIIKAFNDDTNLDIPVSIASPFGGGMSVGSTCGAITGALMAIGALKGRNTIEEKNNSRVLSREVVNKVREKYGTLECVELKKKGIACDEIIKYAYGILKEYTTPLL
jgi:C_GCAxxG_C_C family probable redox protein